MKREGQCACGQLRFEADGEPITVHCCHCLRCQRETGTAFATNYLIEADRVTLSGEVERIETPSASGKGQTILRCPECKVAVSSHYSGAGDAVHFLRVGTMADHADIVPDIHIYTSTRQPWVAIPERVLAFAEFYNPAEVWSSEQLRRWGEASAG